MFLSKVRMAANLTILFDEEIKSHNTDIVVFFKEGLTLGICITLLAASILILSSILYKHTSKNRLKISLTFCSKSPFFISSVTYRINWQMANWLLWVLEPVFSAILLKILIKNNLSFFFISRSKSNVWKVSKFSSFNDEDNFSEISLIHCFAMGKPLSVMNKVQQRALDATSWFLLFIASRNNLSTTLTLEASVISPKRRKQFGLIKSSSPFNSVINDPVNIKLLCHQFKCLTNKKITRRRMGLAEWRSFVALKNIDSFSFSVNFSPLFKRYIRFIRISIHCSFWIFFSLNIDAFWRVRSFRRESKRGTGIIFTSSLKRKSDIV